MAGLKSFNLYFPDENKVVSSEQFEHDVIKCINFLRLLNLKNDDALAIFGETTYYYVLFMVSCYKVGLTHVLISEKYKILEMKNIFDKLDKFYIMDLSDESKFQNFKCDFKNKILGIKTLKDYLDYSDVQEKYKNKKIHSNFRCMFPTSGTTGILKLISWATQDLLKDFECLQKGLSLKQNNTILITTPVYHLASMHYLGASLLSGCNIVFLKKFSVSNCINLIKSMKISKMFGVPSVYFSIIKKMELSKLNNISVDSVICAGDIITEDLVADIFKYFNCKRVYDYYGMSEMGSVYLKNYAVNNGIPQYEKAYVNVYELKLDENNPVYINGMPNYEIMVKKDKLSPYLSTGDLAYYSNGELVITGRKKSIIVKGGENISPKFIENILKKNLYLDNVLVFGINDKFYGQDICVCIESVEDGTKIKEKIFNFISKNLSKVYLPKKIMVLKEFPLLPSRKIDINKIKKYGENNETLY